MDELEVVLRQNLGEGQSATFTFRDECGMLSEGFVLRRGERLFAYRNQCRHQPLTLDYGDGEFFTEDRQYLLCRNHGALYEPETGYCVSGPCTGASLFPLKVTEEPDGLHILIPQTELQDLE